MPRLQHSGRLSLIVGEVSWRLSDDGLTMTTGQSSRTIPYASIASVRLITFASPGGRQGRAILTTKGHGTHKIGSHHYVSLGNFENRASSYVPLVRMLAQRVAVANPQARFTVGSLGLSLAWIIVCLLVLGVGVLVVLAATEETAPRIRLAGTAMFLAGVGALAVRWVKRNAPRSFEPNLIPDELLV